MAAMRKTSIGSVALAAALAALPQAAFAQAGAEAAGAGSSSILLLVLTIAVVVGFVALGIITAGGFRELGRVQSEQMSLYLSREEKMREREKFVLAAMLESEMNANKVKLEAFLVVYEEMLKGLREQSKDQKYRQTGEIVHEQPRLSRVIFDSNIGRMDILEPALASEIAALYSAIHPDPGYVTLEPNTPLQDTVYQVEKVIGDAQDIMEPMDRVLAALQVILRDKKSSAMSPLAARKNPGSGPGRKS